MTEAVETPPLEEQVIGLAVLIATAFRLRDFETMTRLLRRLVEIVDRVDDVAR